MENEPPFAVEAPPFVRRLHVAAPRRDARIFEKHANITVSDGGCKAQDVLDLSRQMAVAVKTKFGFDLTPEVRALGRFK